MSDVQGQWPQAQWLIRCLQLAATRIRLALLCLLAAFLLADCLGWLAGCWLPASSLGRGGWLGTPSRAAAARTCGRPAAWLPRLADWLLLLAGLTPGCWLLRWLGDGHRFLARAIAPFAALAAARPFPASREAHTSTVSCPSSSSSSSSSDDMCKAFFAFLSSSSVLTSDSPVSAGACT